METSAGTLDADFLVVALGAVGGLGKFASLKAAHDLYDPHALPAMRQALSGVDAGRIVISVLGTPFLCPPAPYEAAFLVDEYLRRRGVRDRVEVAATTPQSAILPASEAVSEYVAEALAQRGIELRTNQAGEAGDGEGQRLSFADGASLDYTLLLAVPQAAPAPVVAQSALAGKDGWARPDRETARTEFDGVFSVETARQ